MDLVTTNVRVISAEDNILVVEAIDTIKREPDDDDQLDELSDELLAFSHEVDEKPCIVSPDESSRVSVSESEGQAKRKQSQAKKRFQCKQCDKEFNHKSTLSRHKHTIHNPSAPIYICDHCSKVYKTKNSLIRHLKKLESGNNRARGRSSLLVKCAVCDFSANKSEIISHYETDHDAPMEKEQHTFASFDEFLVWKNQIENDTISRYVKIRQDRIVKDGTVESFYRCHRDGYYKPRGKHLRNLKKIGSNKINGHCPAKMQVLIKNGEVNVTFVKTHMGHAMELSRIALTKEERDAIARQLALQVPFERILDEVKTDTVNGDSDGNVKRVNLLTRKDLYNIETSYSLSKVTHRNCLGINVENWIQENIAEHFDSFIKFYKPQGKLLENHPQLVADDFHLVLMNDPQVHIMRSSSNGYVCLDACTLVHDFVLVSLVVLDENDQAFPCAFLVTNNYSVDILEIMFSSIKDVCNCSFSPSLFMSNLEDSFCRAWTKVMGPPQFRIYSPWVVDMDWRGNLIRIDDEEKQEEVYASLMSLAREKNIQVFEEQLYAVHKKLLSDPVTADFGDFFDVYRSRASSWAHCLRAHISPFVSEQLDLIQRCIRIIQTTREKKILRMDKYIVNLMSTVKEQLFDALVFRSPELLESLSAGVKRRHELGEEYKNNIVTRKAKHWIVHSDGEDTYKIRSSKRGQKEAKPCKCDQICPFCGVCGHVYVCSCVNSSIKWIMCEHVHAICLRARANRAKSLKNSGISSKSGDMEIEEDMITEEEPQDVIISVPESTFQYLTVADPDGGEEGVVLAFDSADLEGEQELVLTYADPSECEDETKVEESEAIVVDESELSMEPSVEERRSLLMQKCQAILSRISNEAEAAAFEHVMHTIETEVPFEQK